MKSLALSIFILLWSFTLSAQADIDLLFPQNGSDQSNNPTFIWNSSGASFISYQVVIFSCAYESSIDLSAYSPENNVSGGSCEYSGLAVSPVDSASFITVDNGAATSEILNDSGVDLGGLAFTGLAASDLEGISHLYNNYYVLVEEDLGSVIYFYYDYSSNQQTFTASDVSVEYISSVASNSFGMEGVTYNPLSNKIYAVKEKFPMTILEWDAPVFSTSNTTITGLNNPFDLQAKAVNEYQITDVSGLFHLNQSSDLSGTETGSHILLLSQESKLVLEIDLQGNEISRLEIPQINQAEGIGFKEGKIYIVSEANGGQSCSFDIFSNPDYQPPKPDASNTLNAYTTTNTNFQFPNGTFQSGEHYCWQVIGTDLSGNQVESPVFSFDMASVGGCTDPNACNYDVNASTDDGSCEYSSCADCLGIPNGTSLPGTTCDDANAATVNDIWNSACQCIGTFLTQGCTDILACNFNPNAQFDDGSCEYISCLDCEGVLNGSSTPGTACDDGISATANDTWNSSCVCVGIPVTQGCTDPFACNYNSSAQFDDGSCEYVSCLDCEGVLNGSSLPGTACDDNDPSTFNDLWTATCLCFGTSLNQGCTDALACNYNPSAQFDDGSCEYLSCLDCEGIPNGGATLGTPCDDGNPATVNDNWNSSCICTGVPLSQGCTDNMACNYNPNAQFDDGSCEYLSCLDCEGIVNGSSIPGSTCDDGNPATANDTWSTACVCVGIILSQGCTDDMACNYNPIAQYDDGSCEYMTCLDCEGVVNGGATLGTPCDDGNPSTVNDNWNSSCECIGVPLAQGCTDILACNYNPNAQYDNGTCEYITCLDCEGVLNGNSTPGTTCDDSDPSTVNDSWNNTCICIGFPLTQGCTDADACNYDPSAQYNDGSCEYISCLDCEGTLNGPALPGASCDDSDPTTVSDTWTNTCVCIGMSINQGCTDVTACNYNPNAQYDDGSCEYVTCLDCEGALNGSSVVGTACNDSDPSTINDLWSSTCVCIGTPLTQGCTDVSACNFDSDAQYDDGNCEYISCLDCEGLPNGPATPGSVCNDGDPYTINDVWTSTCVCIGTSMTLGCMDPMACNYNPNAEMDDGSCEYEICIDCEGVMNGPAQPGADCDDGNGNTAGDIYTSDCVCEGILVVIGCMDSLACNYDPLANVDFGSCDYESCLDCLGTANGDILPGTSCDDENENTINDVYTVDCICEGEAILMGCLDMSACNFNSLANVEDNSCLYIGSDCDDDNELTVNDSISDNCECEGDIVNGITHSDINFSLYPNPAKDIINIYSDSSQILDISIFDLAGHLVYMTQVGGAETHSIDLTELEQGTYIYRVANNDQSHTGTLLILR